jgi:hypothetical protein
MPLRRQILVQIDAQLAWQVAHNPIEGRYIGVCKPLNLNAVGDTWVEFTECANEAMQLLFEDLFEQGELEAFLRNHGWSPRTPLPAVGHARPRFDVPFSLEQRARIEELVPA